MSANSNVRVVDNLTEQAGGIAWHRLHSEREDICEALLMEPVPETGAQRVADGNPNAAPSPLWHRELLQARLRKIDDALDRLMSGSYGNCSKCGKWIEDTKLDFDPAIAFCIGCWEREQAHMTANVATSINNNLNSARTTQPHANQALQRAEPHQLLCLH